MRYAVTRRGLFLARPNRFIARVLLDGAEVVCHVKNTGRCRELLVPGATVILAAAENPARKTAWDLVAVYKGGLLINMDSQAPNAAAAEFLPGLFPGAVIRPEVRFGASRFDFAVDLPGRQGFLEVKGVTLERAGLALFPDAPTQRGTRHLEELARARADGLDTWLLLVIQMRGPRAFAPNGETDPAFARALRSAREAGVELLAYDCLVTEDSMVLAGAVPILL